MYQIAKPLFFRTETPMHVGSGNDLGHIDLPIQREKHTDFPMVQSSSLKGAFRAHLEQSVSTPEDKIGVHLTFGYDGDGVKGDVKTFFEKRDYQDFSGALAFTDARLLLFPVKSYKGVFALVTCPMVIDKFYKELSAVCQYDKSITEKFAGKWNITDDKVVVAMPDFLGIDDKVILEEYAFIIDEDVKNKASLFNFGTELSNFLGNQILDRLVIVSDDVFRDFTKLSTEVITRTKIQNDTGTVQSGALFTEEYLPAESYMYSLIAASRVFQKSKKNDKDTEYDNRQAKFPKSEKGNAIKSAEDVLGFFEKHLKPIAQIGGSSTLGKGIVKLFKKELKNGDK
jgi:CRISPR-associated protein Cmr4